MGCIYNTWKDGCSLCDSENPKYNPEGADEKGFCLVESDEDPGHSCGSYETDCSCCVCGADLNIEECECEEE